MVNHPPPFHNNRKSGARRKTGHTEKRGKKKKRTQQGNTMVFGDNVRARKAARALPRTPTTRRRQREEEDKQRDHTPTAIPQPTQHNCSNTTAIPPHTTALPHPQQTRHHTNGRGNRDNTRGKRGQYEEGGPIQRWGHHTTHHTPPFNRATR